MYQTVQRPLSPSSSFIKFQRIADISVWVKWYLLILMRVCLPIDVQRGFALHKLQELKRITNTKPAKLERGDV
jgi:hypothetical protein